jgi:catechol 2,3-dioxygenase-like lactoylglutathione lyase family enzyme
MIRSIDGPITGPGLPFTTSFIADRGLGVDLGQHGFREDEFFVRGTADLFTRDGTGRRVCACADVEFVTRILIRRPRDSGRFSGTVHMEPLHPQGDNGPTWRSAAKLILRQGHAYAGVTVFPEPARIMRETVDPDRYADLNVPLNGLGFDIARQVATALRLPEYQHLLGGEKCSRLYLSGWSATGSFLRVFLNEGFLRDERQADGARIVDGYAICIAGGGDVRLGYWPLSDDCPPVAGDDPRRVVQPAGVPVIELLSEYESESNMVGRRPDADGPDDLFRLFQVAGTSHSSASTSGDVAYTGPVQLAARGVPQVPREINEEESDARFDLVTMAVLEMLDNWSRYGTVPPRVEPFTILAERSDGPCGLFPEARPLARDADGNVVGGIRTYWIEAPTASYLPHSTPKPGRCQVPPGAPMPGPEYLADIVGHRRPFSPETLKRRYGSLADYRARYAAAINVLAGQGFLLLPDAEQLVAASSRWPDWPGMPPAPAVTADRAFQLAEVHHVRLPVSDLSRSFQFWRELLGYERNFDFPGPDGSTKGWAIRHPRNGPNIVLWHDPGLAARTAGFPWFSIGVPSSEAILALAAELDRRGIAHGGVQDAMVGVKLPFVHDPDDHLIGFYVVPERAS